ncbi:MAG: BrnT family toxin [Candidatus Aminicenantes bacterium]|jgi:uncharacterized DUF497 family protein
MKITGILWLEDIVEKLILKHKVDKREVIDVLQSRPFFRFVEKGHRKGENVYSAFGQTEAGRYLVVYFVYKKKNQALILSARDMTISERRHYEKK